MSRPKRNRCQVGNLQPDPGNHRVSLAPPAAVAASIEPRVEPIAVRRMKVVSGRARREIALRVGPPPELSLPFSAGERVHLLHALHVAMVDAEAVAAAWFSEEPSLMAAALERMRVCHDALERLYAGPALGRHPPAAPIPE